MRSLNGEEMAIIAKKEKRMGRKLHVVGIEYRKAFPRSTVCILNKGTYPGLDGMEISISMRGRGDPENPVVGEVQSFVRALNAL